MNAPRGMEMGSWKAAWVVAVLAGIELGIGSIAFASAGERWTVATDDTVLTIGVDEQGRLAILELSNPAQQVNWTGRPSPIPLMNSVELDGKDTPLDWILQKAHTDDSNGTKLTLYFTSTAPKLELKSEWWARPGPGPVRHASFITNKSGRGVKIFYQPTVAVQLTAPQAGPAESQSGKLWMWYFHTSGGRPDPQGVYREEVTEKLDRTLRTQPNGRMVPLVVFDQNGRHGVYVGVEWSFGDIRARGLTAPGTPGARVEAGNVLDFAAQLEAGQVFQVPPGFVGAYDGDIDDAGNRLRKYLFRYSMPEILRNDPTYPKVQWNAFGATGKTPGSWDPVESKYYPLIDDMAPLGFEEVMIDVGWWGGNEPGADPQDWPSGMRKAADYAHERGVRFGLYWTDNENMATPEGRKVRAERIKRLFLEHAVDSWRSDATRGAVIAPDYWSVKGFYELVDGLQQEIPNFQWENCSGGGRIKDYGAMSRNVKIFMSDAYSPLDVRQAFYDNSFAFHPIQLEGHLGSVNGRYRPEGVTGMRYAFRSMSMGAPEWFIDAPNGGNGSDPWTDEEKEAVKRAVATYKAKIRPLVRTADLYHIFPRPDNKAWDGIEYYDPASGKGVVFVFKPDSPNDTQTIRLKGLDADRTYRLTFEDKTHPQADKSGSELADAGIDVTLKGKHVSELIFFEVQEGE